MSDYISRETTIDRLEKLFQLQAPTARAIVEAIPAADVVERKHGKWIGENLASTSGGVYPVVHCSECNIVGYWEPNYCPNCGASMRQQEETE